MRLFFHALLIALLAGGGLSQAVAQQGSSLQSYDVELVVFRVVSPAGSAEDWTLEEKAASHRLALSDEDTNAAANAPVTTANFSTLPASRMKLGGTEEAFKRNRNYRSIVHLGWTQPGFSTQGAQAVPVEVTSADGAHLSGQITLTRGRYLHLTLDLVYEPPTGAVDAGHRYVIRQSRRMRSTERHYIDHPHFGVVALITPTPAG